MARAGEDAEGQWPGLGKSLHLKAWRRWAPGVRDASSMVPSRPVPTHFCTRQCSLDSGPMNGSSVPSVNQAACLMNLRPSGLVWGSVGISCFHLGSHCVGISIPTRASQHNRLLPVWVITGAGTSDSLCPDFHSETNMAASRLLGKEGEGAQLWELLQESGPNKGQDLEQILLEELW